MAQAGLHLPASVARLPVFRTVFADIGDEQSIEASLSTFSSHITNLVSMDRELQLPALVLLDEVGTGTDPNEGGALATAIVQHFRQRGALIIATTHFDAVKTWGIGTEGVAVAAFAFDPQNFAPTYQAPLRRAGAQPGDRDGAAAGHAAVGDRGGARVSERRSEASAGAPVAAGRAGACARERSRQARARAAGVQRDQRGASRSARNRSPSAKRSSRSGSTSGSTSGSARRGATSTR